jgi:hypothetical protein
MFHRDGARRNLADRLSFLGGNAPGDEMRMHRPAVSFGHDCLSLPAPDEWQRLTDTTSGLKTGHQKLQKKIDSRSRVSELRQEKDGENIKSSCHQNALINACG